MSELKELALRVAVLKALSDQVTKAGSQARAELLRQMHEAGAEKVAAELPGGRKVASVSLAGGHKVSAVVVDEAELLAWVREQRPEELEERIRPAYRRALLEELARNGEEVPGVELTLSTSYVSNRFATGGQHAIAQAWSSGALALPEVLALPTAEQAAAEHAPESEA
ncbi:hypothetical protein [Actinomadura sp. 21ATH]|uniref:hypothetical protein n=1 Tax=Actinomadura sp. 21ATH TaxID=1735444 RepID=UPI0035C06C3D